MVIRTGPNAPLGVPRFDLAHDAPFTIAPGTIVEGNDDTNSRTNEYIFLISPANIAIGDDVTYDAAYTATEVAAGAGQADAIVASGAGQGAWFLLKSRRTAVP